MSEYIKKKSEFKETKKFSMNPFNNSFKKF